MSDALDEKELQDALVNRLRDWKVSGRALERTFAFDTFKDAIKFVNLVAEHAETINHHPDMFITFNKVKLTLSSHDVGAITRRDLVLAGHANEAASNVEFQKHAA